MTEPTIACYIRVSTAKQKTDSQSSEIRKWLDRSGIDPAAVEWFEDFETGKTLRRPAFQRMQAAIFSGRIRTVICWKLDRLSRRQRDGINLLADWCERDLRTIVVTQQIDLSGAVGRLVASVMLGLAEIELEHREQRQRAGIEVAKARGVYTGRKPGTTKAKPERARELFARGIQTEEIARLLGTSQRTIQRYLTDAVTPRNASRLINCHP